MSSHAYDDLLRDLTPQVVAAVTRRCGDFDVAEDAVQDALVEAARTWPERGLPDSPRGWLISTAMRRLIDAKRAESARRARERSDLLREPTDGEAYAADDSLDVLLLCCHPSLTPASAIALTLRAVGGLTTREIAAAFLTPERTMAQRISRSKATIKEHALAITDADDLTRRVPRVLKVLYLLFNEGYVATTGEHLQRVDLCAEAIRITRLARTALPQHTELAGLLALMLLLDARRPARVDAHGAAVPLADQDRTLWDRTRLAEGTALIDATIAVGRPGAYQIQAAIAAVHDRARDAQATDWPQVRALYGLLEQVAPSPVVTLNKAVAVAYAESPSAGLDLLGSVDLSDHPRVPAVHGHLLELAGDFDGAAAAYDEASTRATNLAERRYLLSKAAALRGARP